MGDIISTEEGIQYDKEIPLVHAEDIQCTVEGYTIINNSTVEGF